MSSDSALQRVLVAMTFDVNDNEVDMEFSPLCPGRGLEEAFTECEAWIHDEFRDNPRVVKARIREGALDAQHRITALGRTHATFQRGGKDSVAPC